MDLGCLDLGCISVSEKHNNNSNNEAVSGDSDRKIGDSEGPVMSSSPKIGKSKVSKGTGVSPRTSVNKSYSQMKKSFRKGSSPLNWFPRKKVDSYLKRKIRLLQEVGGMTSTLDETLGDSNPHYSRVLREKIAAREAACKAMEARKTAMVEASWCRILKAARIQSKEAETLLQEAEKTVAEAFEAAAALEVIMYDRPDCPRKPCEVESSSINMGGSTTHTVTASFETAFEVDKEVAAAVKAAFIRLANCPSSLHKDEHKDLLWRISQNPDMNEATEEVSECSSGCESDTRSELELQSLGDSSSNKLIDMMLERLKCLQEDELASLATIVATCGLNAVLLEVENTKHHASGLDYNFKPPSNRRFSIGQTRKEQAVEVPSLDKFLVKHMSKLEREVQEAKSKRKNDSKGRTEDRTQSIGILSEAVPDLGSILVKHASKLEKEIEEAKRTTGKEFELKCKRLEKIQEDVPSLDKFLVKHVSRLEREVQEARNRRKNGPIERGVAATTSHGSASSREQTEKQEMVNSSCEVGEQTEKQEMVSSSCEVGEQVGKENINLNKQADKVLDVGTIKDCAEMEQSEKQDTATISAEHSSIDVCSEKKSLTIKTMSRIERAKLETMEAFSFQNGDVMRGSDCSLDRILVKPVNRLEREKRQALASGMEYGTRTNKTKHERTNDPHCESLDKVLVKHVHRLEKEKMEFASKEEEKKVKSIDSEPKNCNDRLDQVLVKHQSRLEKGELASQKQVDEIKHSKTRREERERELQEAWGGLSLGNLGSAAQSRLEKEKLGLQQPADESKHLRTRREERDRELQEAWGGLGLGNAVRPHLSRLEREKAAWKKADKEEESRGARRDIET